MKLKQRLIQTLSFTSSAQPKYCLLQPLKNLRAIVLVIIILSINSSEIWAGSPGTYQEQLLTMAVKIKEVLIKYQYCKDKNDCTIRKILFLQPTSTGIVITTYQIEDPKVIQEIMAACVLVYIENQQQMTIGLGMYREPHERMMGIFAPFLLKPFISLSLKGAQP